jgi:hypothetical protein
MTDFLLQISAQVTLENLRLQDLTRVDGLRPFHDIPDIDPRPFVLATRPSDVTQLVSAAPGLGVHESVP